MSRQIRFRSTLNLGPAFAIGLPNPESGDLSRPSLIASLGCLPLPVILRAPMSTTFDKVADIIAETCDIPRDTITPESHAIDDLKIDSLDFLDIAFAIDKAFGIKLPLEKWTQEVNDGKASAEQYFQLDNLCSRIDELVAAKSASALAAEPAARSGSSAYD